MFASVSSATYVEKYAGCNITLGRYSHLQYRSYRNRTRMHFTRCTLHAGLPVASDNNQYMSFPCYRAFAPAATLTDSVSTRHTIVLVKYDGTVDTSTSTGYGWGGTAAMPWAACHTAAYAAANNYFYIACGPGRNCIIRL